MASNDAFAILDRAEPIEDRRAHANDATSDVEKDALPLAKLEAMLQDIQRQPSWRTEADKCCDYYDGNQLDSETLSKLEARGLGPLITNLVKPTVDAVLGLEAKTRTDWKVVADDERHAPVAEFLDQKLFEAERESGADRACSDAYAGEIKSGFHAVEVSRSTNPFDYEYRVRAVHRREIYWDWRSVQPDWSDARWVIRQRWVDPDVLAAHFPKAAALIKSASLAWRGDWQSLFSNTQTYELLNSGIQTEQRSSIEEMEWRDTERNRVRAYEVWYRTYHRGAVITLPTGRKIEYDPKNPQHVALVAAGLVKIRVGVLDRMRVAFFVGPHRISDRATLRRRFPYVPFWGYREDLTGSPYGLIRSMMSPQDEVNARRAKMMWLLSQRRVRIDRDAVDEKFNTLSDASRELARADGFIVTNPNALNKNNSIQVDENLELGQFQFRLLEESMNAVQKSGGVYAVMLGQAQSGVTANSAMQTLIEQGTTTLAEINDNYSYGRRAVGEALLEMIREDLAGVEMEMLIDTGSSKRKVFVNRPAMDPQTNQQFLENNTETTPVKVQLSDVPSTPSYRAQQLAQLAEVTKSLSPELQAFVTPFMVEATDLPKRREIAALLRKQMGIEADPDTPEAQQAAEAAAQKMAAMEELNFRSMAADVAEKEARANKANAEAQKAIAELNAPPEQADQTPIIRQQFENQLVKIEAAYKEQLLALKTQAAQALIKHQTDIAAMEIKYQEKIDQADIAIRKEELTTERELELANINASAQADAQAVQKRIDDAANRYEEQIAQLRQEIKDLQADMNHKAELAAAEAKARDEREALKEQARKESEAAKEKAEKERQQAEEKRRNEEAKKSDDDDKKEKSEETKESQPMTIVVNVDAKPAGSRKITKKQGKDGSTTYEVQEGDS